MIRFFVLLFLFSSSSFAVLPDEVLDDPVLEAEAIEISRLLRCVVCQNQTIDESQSDLARDLRLLVRERLVAGDNRSEVLSFVSERYGEFVLLSPSFRSGGIILWLSAPFLFILGLLVLYFYYRRFRCFRR